MTLKNHTAETGQSKSMDLYQRALKVMPGGASRSTLLRSSHLYYADKGEGCYVTDLEGVKRIDFANNMASLIHGHAHPAVVEAVTAQLQKGTAFSMATEQELLYAEHLCQRTTSFENIRFVNSGTEAVMFCLKAARAYTGRSKIAKLEGAYHGLYDYAEVSQTANPANWGEAENPASVAVAHGTPDSVLSDVVVIPFNDVERAIAILDRHRDELACVLIDLMPHRVCLAPATVEFVKALHQWTQANGALLVYDEVITYRSSYGGTQEWYNVHPDLTAIGKLIGGGFPVGAFAGRKEVMDVVNPLLDRVPFPQSGTFSANPVTMVAGRVSMEMFDHVAVNRLNNLGERARLNIADAIRIADIPACVTGGGSMFRVHMKEKTPENYREAFVNAEQAQRTRILLDHLFDNGFMLINSCSGALSTPMTEKEVDNLAEEMLNGFRKVKEILPAANTP